MNTQAIIDQLTNNQILLSVNGDRLAVEAKKGALTPELASLIRDNKPALMEYLSQQQAPLAAVNPIQPVVREAGKSYPLSSAQKRFWFIDQLRGGSSDYHMPLAFTLTDAVSMTHLESALNHVLKKHEILRSRYVLAADGAAEQQLSDESISIRYHDSATCDEQTFKADIQACIAAPFVLDSDLMIRVDHFRTPDALHADALLIINIHHIACDAWSLDILKQDLMTAYMQLQGGMQPQAELPLQYLDYASWQQDWLNGEQCAQQTDYWRNKLAGMAQLHSLPLDHARQADKANFGKLYSEALPVELVPVLHRIAREYKLTPFMLLHSALALALSQYGQYQDVVMGTTISNRDSEQLHPMIGCFLNRLVLRLDTDRAQSLSDYLKQVARTHIEAQNNQLLPFDNLVEALEITRAANYSPLFQIQFTLGSELGELSSQDAALLSNAGFAGFELSKETVVVRGDLDIHARVSEQNMVIDWSYDNELFDTQTIATLSSLFQQICRNLTQAYQQQTITTASVADVMFNQPQTLYTQVGECRLDDATGLIERFEQQAALTPDAIAVHSDTEQLSYAQLNAQAAKLADCLQEQGVEPGDLVGVCMPRSACLMVSLLGVLKAGAAYIPFEPSNTKARNQQIIADAALEWVIVSDALAARVPDAGVDLLLLEQDVTDANWLSGYDSDFCAETVAHDSPAYVIYTSGSTGTPKGVEISHRALMDYLNFALKGYYADHLNGSLLVTSHGFDIGVPSLYLPLLSGGSVQLLDNQELLPVLSKALNKADEPRLVRMTPHHVEGILALQEAPLAGVQHVFVIGGERFERDVALALQTQFPDSQVFNHYGPSEATVGCVMYDISANQADLPAELPIGRAMDNTYAYVLDAQLNALPQGARGELFVGGPCLATGYVNNPTLSAERFIENPFYDPSDATSPARLYRTGDQVRYQNSGELMFLGRIDEQVKIRGFRVELGDISSQLQQVTGVESAEVLCKCAETVAHDSPAYVIYTSGSTGTPKGVEISHRALMDYLNFALKGYYADHLNGSLLVTSHGFDIGVPSLYLPLLSGGSVQLLDNQELLPVLSKALNKADEPRLVRMTPHHVEGILALQEAPLAGVQHVFVIGGERFERDVALALQTQFPDSQVFNHYGPSEATVGCVMYDISANQADLPAELPIGRAMDNTYAYVLDAQLNALPQGARGELFVGGPCLATGYVNNPTLSAERFIENPFYDPSDATSPARLYRTGDQVRYQNSGELMFLGRIDEQVKIRGFRVELGDISSQLQQITGVESAEVLCKPLSTGPELVAYIKAQDSAQLGALLSDCERLLGEQLPAYMVPAHFVGLQHWPLTANGKLDKKALPDPQEKAAAQHVAPRTATEQQLVELWSSLLKLTPEQISVDSSFFKLGGHSLLSVRLVAAIKQAFGVEFSISELFEHASIASQAQQVEHKQAQGGSTAQRIEVQARPQDGRMAASFAQQRLWFIDRLQGGSAQYNMPAAFEVSGELDLNAVEAALNTIVARHEVLRSVYRDGDSGTEQVIQTDVHFTLDYEDLRLLSPATQQQTIASLIPRLQSQPFDLSKDLMIRAAYIDTGADSEHASVLLFNIHHIASDGWSLQLLVKEFVLLYRAYTQSQDNPLTPLSIQYADYAHWQHSYLSGPVLERQLTYWSEQLSDLPPVHSLPLDHPRPQVKQHVGELVQGKLDSDVAAGLAELAQSQGLTSFMLLHSALSLLLSRHSNSKDVVIGTPVANRTQTELESLIGFFVNTLVLRVNTAQPDITRYLEHVKAVHLGAQSHQDVPFEQLVERLNVPRSTAHSPLFQIMLTTQTDYGLDDQATEQGELDLNGAALTMRGAAQTVAKFDIEVNISTSAQGVAINWVYDKALFTHAHISTLNRHLMQILTQLSQLQSTSVPLSSIALLSAQERTHLLETLNPTPVDYDTSLTMAQWIERQVAKTPTQTALCYEGQTLSYQSLNDKANQLARHLRAEHQVAPGTLVGVCMTRSLEMVIGILAILKAGGAYVPLDPTLPETRLDYMLAHAGITTILTQSEHQSKCQANNENTPALILMDGYAQDATRFEDYATQDLSPQETGLSAQDMAYMIYTSGSTGKPKGVLVSHQALVNRVDWMDKQYGCDHHDVILQKTPFGFDVSVWEFMWPLCRGAQMVLARPEGHKDPQYLCQLIRQNGVTKLHFVPSMLGIMLDYGALAQCTSIRQVFCSGEALQVKQVQGFRASLPDAQLHNLYGPTEAAIDVSYWDCSQPISTTVPIGKPIQNIQLLILDDDLQLVPFGSAGELFIGGDGLAWGYHNQPELTAERFINNPYQSEMGARASYSEVQGEIYQQAQAPYDCQVERFDLSTLEASAQAEALEQNLITFSQHAFVLQEAQMLSARYLILSDQSGVLALNMPHIVSDGWSMQLLVKEFTALYTAHLSGQHAQLAPLPIQYADYAHWQRNWLAGDAGVSQLDYWKKQLDGVPTVHGLPLQGRRGEMKNHNGESLEMTLSQSVSHRLTELASTLEITPFMLLHGALAIVLSRHSNSHDIVIGTPVANRQHADLTSLIGFFVNSLVLRLNTSDKTLGAFFEHVKQTHIAAQENQDIPFEQLVEHLDIETNTSQSPLFQIMLLTDNDYGLDAPKAQSTRLGDAQLKPIEDPQVTVKFDLDIFMSVNEHGGKLKINFDNHLFSAQYIDSLMSHLANTLTNLAQADMAAQSVARLPMLSEQQSQELIFGRNQTQRSYDDEACINSIFERHVAAQPDAPALQFGESVLSYQALNERAEQLASYLVAQHQIVPDTIVGLCMERSADMIIAMLAILKAGGAYLPLDPDYPMERLEYMVDDAKVAQILSYGRGVEVTDALCQGRDIANLNVSNLSEAAASDEQALGILKSNHSLAYVIYTSGSTGRPKGVGLSHKGAVNLAANQQVLFDITPASRVLQFASISFDAATWDWVMALLNGATLVICDEQARTEGGKLGEVLKQQAITHATLPPALLSTMALQTDLALQCLIVAGEACEEQVVERWRRHYRFFNAYGPSETSVCATVGEITDNSIHIGRPLYNVQTLILDEHQSLVPFGCAGELYVGGDGLARGYLNQPQLTAERFIDNPFYDASVPGSSERLYRTGDLVRYQVDGNLAFIGRTDDQIKIRGFRVELGEIAQQLSQQAGVESALVVAKTGAIGTYLVAYLQPAQAVSELSDNEFTQGALAELASQVPDYMVPKLGVVVAEWPLTANGKINKKALPEADTMALQGEYVAPACETEHAICQIWAELLDMAPETISTTANFFHLGGHSLLSVRLAAGLREQLGVELPVKTLFNAATIAEQAAEIMARRGQAVREGVKALPRITMQDEQLGQYSALPQSFAQQRLWFIDQLHSDSAQYNMPAAFEVEGELELAVVEAALQTIIARHEVLRTVYRDGEHGAEQLILDEAQFSLSYEDIRMYNAAQQQQAIAGAMAQLLSQPFDLTKDVMVRAGYLHTSQSSGVLLFNMHHIASDGWSMQVLVKEFVALYQAYSQGQGNPLAPLTIQYADYAQWQRAYLSETVLEQQLGYWQQQLADVPPVHSLPLDHPRPEVKQHQGAQVTGSLSKEVAQGLAALAKAEGLTPFMLLHGALSLLLSRHSNAQNIVIGTPVANRTQAELEPLIGFFVNTLVLNVNTDQATLAEYLAHVKSVHLDAQSNQDVPFEQLVEQLNVPRSTAHTPLFQVMLRTQTDYGLNTGMDESVLSLGDAQLSPLADDSVVAKFDLDVHMALSESGVDICWTYDTALFSAARIETLNRHLGELLSALTASEPQEVLTRVPGTLNMLSQAEQQELLVSLNQTEQDYDTQLCIHTLFEQQAQQQPQAIALTGPQRTLSYEALNTLSNQFAHHLIDQYGVAPGQRVGICVERSEYILVTMLAVLKAGAAYVPFDHHNTLHRNQQIIDDAQLDVVFTDPERIATLPQSCARLEVAALEAQLSDQGKRDNPQQTVSAGDLAYVIYTSGTTGKPKGVQLRHSNVCDYLQSVQCRYYAQPQSSLLVTSYAFDISVPSLFLPLISGTSVNILAGEARFESMKHELQEQPYLLRMTPHHGKALVAFMGEELCQLTHTFVIGGEAFPLELYDQLQAKFPNSVIYNHYGPTEATVGAIALNVTAQRDQIGATMPIGRPLPNTKVYILNKELGLVPKGAMGELYIAGPSVSKGYLNRDELTQKSFVVNPFEGENSQYNLMYKTGDLARYIGEDYLEYCGRVDEQIKIRGFRIEVGDIESQLLQLPEVDSAVVQAKELAGQLQLVAYVKFDLMHEIKFASSESQLQDNERKLAAIKRSLAGQLPEYMLPSQYLVMTDWPLSANGKLDKKALPEPSLTELSSVAVQPVSETEVRLVQIWSEVLQTSVEHISVVESFFSLGGNSLSLMLLLNKLRSEFGAALQLRELYQSSDIQSMAKRIEHLLWMEQDDDDEYEGELLVL
ncbi:hypothetical protein PRUB_a5355 [Pseudoalteromonas rubra]|uniref:Carrier domain-containing protein n=2 Tax=Pseudoalteromonas rubra TaxID=43658 RepID=A0A8T0C528_9GAMM|nr:non-ribosomal peptide synthetase [Pseudoalteromonas rubra]KAF7783783.1 hypothetical protein PRUB_a5355 [Pseudoalteromonas rubra]